MNFDELKKIVRMKFPDSILIRCTEGPTEYGVHLMPNDAKPIFVKGNRKFYMIFNGDYLVDKRTKKIIQIPDSTMITSEMKKRLLGMKIIYQNEDYPDA